MLLKNPCDKFVNENQKFMNYFYTIILNVDMTFTVLFTYIELQMPDLF